jgi:hypothetical protein
VVRRKALDAKLTSGRVHSIADSGKVHSIADWTADAGAAGALVRVEDFYLADVVPGKGHGLPRAATDVPLGAEAVTATVTMTPWWIIALGSQRPAVALQARPGDDERPFHRKRRKRPVFVGIGAAAAHRAADARCEQCHGVIPCNGLVPTNIRNAVGAVVAAGGVVPQLPQLFVNGGDWE